MDIIIMQALNILHKLDLLKSIEEALDAELKKTLEKLASHKKEMQKYLHDNYSRQMPNALWECIEQINYILSVEETKRRLKI